MWQYNYTTQTDELMHYGVLGMKGGHHKIRSLEKANTRLNKKAASYDKASIKYTSKSEKAHAINDLGRSNQAALSSAKYAKKSLKYTNKANKTTNDSNKYYYEKKAAKMKYKSENKKRQANTLSKSAGYGLGAMKYAIKADNYAASAAKSRYKITRNEKYINTLNRRYSSITEKELSKGKEYVKLMQANS